MSATFTGKLSMKNNTMLIPRTLCWLLFCLCVAALATAQAPMKQVAAVPLPCDSDRQAISPAGDQVAVQCSDHTLRLLDIHSGETRFTFPAKQRITSYAYSPDGRWFAAGFWDGSVQMVATSGEAKPVTFKSTKPRIEGLAFFPDARGVVLAPIDQPGQVWMLGDDPRQYASLPPDFGGLTDCAFSPDGKLLVTAGDDTIIRFYDTKSWDKVYEYRGLKLESFSVTFTPDGKNVLVGGADTRVTVLDSKSGQLVRTLPTSDDPIALIAAIGGGKALVVYFDVDGKKPPHQSIVDLPTGQSTQLATAQPITGGGMVHKKLWLSTVKNNVLDVWEWE